MLGDIGETNPAPKRCHLYPHKVGMVSKVGMEAGAMEKIPTMEKSLLSYIVKYYLSNKYQGIVYYNTYCLLYSNCYGIYYKNTVLVIVL